MIAVGIVLGIFAYAVVYSGVQEIRSGQGVGILETLSPKYVPPPPKAPATGTTSSGFANPPNNLWHVITSPFGEPKRDVKNPPGFFKGGTFPVGP